MLVCFSVFARRALICSLVVCHSECVWVCATVSLCVHSMAVHLSPGEQLPVLSLSSLPLQEHTTWSDIRSRTHAHACTRMHRYSYMYTVCLSICLPACRRTFVRPSFRTHHHKAHQSQSSAFLLSLCLPVCLPIYLSVIQTVTNDGFGCVCVWGGFTCAIWHPQLKLNRVLNGRDTKWLQQSSCCKMATDGSCDTESKVSKCLRPFLVVIITKFKEDVDFLDETVLSIAVAVGWGGSKRSFVCCSGVWVVSKWNMCARMCVCVCVFPRGTLIGAISSLPHDRCSLFTVETSMPTPA